MELPTEAMKALMICWWGPEADDDSSLSPERLKLRIDYPGRELLCISCAKIIPADAPGNRIPSFMDGPENDGFHYWHRRCFERSVTDGF